MHRVFQFKYTLITAIAVITLSLISSSEFQQRRLWYFEGMDKVIHVCMYMTLSSLFFLERYWSSKTTSANIIKHYNIIPLLLFGAMGGAIELLQPLVAARSCEVTDFLCNITGLILGFYLQILFIRILKR